MTHVASSVQTAFPIQSWKFKVDVCSGPYQVAPSALNWGAERFKGNPRCISLSISHSVSLGLYVCPLFWFKFPSHLQLFEQGAVPGLPVSEECVAPSPLLLQPKHTPWQDVCERAAAAVVRVQGLHTRHLLRDARPGVSRSVVRLKPYFQRSLCRRRNNNCQYFSKSFGFISVGTFKLCQIWNKRGKLIITQNP